MRLNNNRNFICLPLSVLLTCAICFQALAQTREGLIQTTGGAQEPSPFSDPTDAPSGQYVLDEIKLELTRLEGRIQDLERTDKDKQNAQDLSTILKETVKKLEDRLTQLEQTQTELAENLKKLQATEIAHTDPHAIYEQALAKFHQEKYDIAVDQFSSYLSLPKIRRAEDATFYRAESYFKLKNFKKAIVDYSKIPEKYRKSPHMPEALLKIGLSFESLGMKEDAKGFFQELVQKYPRSVQAKRAHTKVK